MNIHEHQAKDILREFEAPVPKGVVVYNIKEIGWTYESLRISIIFIIEHKVIQIWKAPFVRISKLY